MTIPMFILPLGIIGPTQLIIIVAVIVIFFGGKKIPELMRGMGRGVKEFKDAVGKDYSQDDGIADAEIIEERKAIPASKKRISKTSTARKSTAKKTASAK